MIWLKLSIGEGVLYNKTDLKMSPYIDIYFNGKNFSVENFSKYLGTL